MSISLLYLLLPDILSLHTLHSHDRLWEKILGSVRVPFLFAEVVTGLNVVRSCYRRSGRSA